MGIHPLWSGDVDRMRQPGPTFREPDAQCTALIQNK